MTSVNEINAYLESLRSQRHLAGHTISNYCRDLNELVTMLGNGTANAQVEFAAVTQAHIRRCTSQLHARGLSARSIARKLSAWRGFFDWLAESVALSMNPVDGVKAPKRGKPLPKALSADDAVRLVAAPFTGAASTGVSTSSTTSSTSTARRNAAEACNRAMFELLYSSGLRVSELVNLDVFYAQQGGQTSAGWINYDAHEVTVTGKGGKMRIVPVGRPAMDAIKDWLAVRVQLARPDVPALFISAQGQRISTRLVQNRLKAHAQKIGIPVNVHPHVLRHSFASHVLQSSGDLRAVQEMLGHASITSTQIYTSLDFQRLAQVYDAAHPRARRKI